MNRPDRADKLHICVSIELAEKRDNAGKQSSHYLLLPHPSISKQLSPGSPGWGFSFPRPLVQHARSLADGHADPRPMLCPTIEDAFGLVQAAAREQHLSYALTVSAPLVDLVEIAMIGDQGLVSFFVGPVAHCIVSGFGRPLFGSQTDAENGVPR